MEQNLGPLTGSILAGGKSSLPLTYVFQVLTVITSLHRYNQLASHLVTIVYLLLLHFSAKAKGSTTERIKVEC